MFTIKILLVTLSSCGRVRLCQHIGNVNRALFCRGKNLTVGVSYFLHHVFSIVCTVGGYLTAIKTNITTTYCTQENPALTEPCQQGTDILTNACVPTSGGYLVCAWCDLLTKVEMVKGSRTGKVGKKLVSGIMKQFEIWKVSHRRSERENLSFGGAPSF
jgi:hypothetical protein